MLKFLRITNFALIDQLEIPFQRGLNVLTGETGAGKSIVLDALDAALGGEVSKKSIRTGSSKAQIEAMFDLTPELSAWLSEQELDPGEDGEIICSREISDRTSRSRVNGVLVNKQQMQQLRTRLVEITAQGQTMQLQDPGIQRRWLDGLGGSEVLACRKTVLEAHQSWSQARLALETHQRQQQDRLQRLDLLQFQAQELNAARLQDAQELESLEKERDRLAHRVDLQAQSYAAYQLLYQGEGEVPAAADLLAKGERILQDMCQIDPDLSSILEMVSNAVIQIEEAGRSLNQYGEDLDTDPGRLEKVERRVNQLRQLCRKYGPSLGDVIRHAERVFADLDRLKADSTSLEELESRQQEARSHLEGLCQHLSQLRRRVGDTLQRNLVKELKPLGMGGVKFAVELQPGSLSAEGQDQVTFMISANPGEPLQSLASIASGGEMSRFLLALKAVFSQVDPVATMVFDEIDTGVSGKVAQAIATRLHTIARQHQVLCVTHQPLIAAMADHHLRVRKVVRQERTSVQVDPLTTQERRDELAQLAGGHSAQEALAFVESLLVQAGQPRTS